MQVEENGQKKLRKGLLASMKPEMPSPTMDELKLGAESDEEAEALPDYEDAPIEVAENPAPARKGKIVKKKTAEDESADSPMPGFTGVY
jgi:hypothetical protein